MSNTDGDGAHSQARYIADSLILANAWVQITPEQDRRLVAVIEQALRELEEMNA